MISKITLTETPHKSSEFFILRLLKIFYIVLLKICLNVMFGTSLQKFSVSIDLTNVCTGRGKGLSYLYQDVRK